eukprot:366014-Chlamydomonas_euryale.AAC.11
MPWIQPVVAQWRQLDSSSRNIGGEQPCSRRRRGVRCCCTPSIRFSPWFQVSHCVGLGLAWVGLAEGACRVNSGGVQTLAKSLPKKWALEIVRSSSTASPRVVLGPAKCTHALSCCDLKRAARGTAASACDAERGGGGVGQRQWCRRVPALEGSTQFGRAGLAEPGQTRACRHAQGLKETLG